MLVYNRYQLFINMKKNPIMIIKHDQAKKKSGPVDLKRKIGSLPIDLPSQQNSKIQQKPRSTSKSQEKSNQFSFSKSFLISNRFQNRSISNDRIKSSSIKGRNSKLDKQSPMPVLKIDKIERPGHYNSKLNHYHSTDKEIKKGKVPNSKSKSYLIDYLNNRNQTTKAESLSKLQRLKKQEKAKSQGGKQQLKQIKYAFRTRQGTLITNPNKPNQDSYLIKSNIDGSYLFSVADGHGLHGHFVSQLATGLLEKHFEEKFNKSKNNELFFTEIFNNIQKQLYETKEMNAHTSGSTMVSLLLQPDSNLTCANVGDSRAILARQIDKKNWEIIHLSEDHKPSLQKEKRRILKRGGKVHCFRDEQGNQVGPQRVWLPNQNLQGLAMSRSLGDNVSKAIGVTHEPEIVNIQIQERDKFILIASDGVWQFIKNFQILQLVVPFFKEGKLQECCDALMKLAYERWTVQDCTVIDDITFVLIFLNQS